MSATFLDTATSYRDAGLSFFPTSQKLPAFDLLPRRFDPKIGKKKHTWIGYQQRQPLPEEIQFWYDGHERASELALVCGPSSHGNIPGSGLFVIDIDLPALISRIRDASGSLWKEVAIERSRRGGLHLGMLCDEADEFHNKKIAMRPNPSYISNVATPDEPRYFCDIESRGNGGYVCVWPTPNYSLEQRDYTHLPWVDMDEVVYPLLEIMSSFNQVSMEPSRYAARADRNDSELPSIVKSIINAFRDRYSVTDMLLAYGYTPVGGRRFRRPGGKSGSVIVNETNEIAAAWSSTDPLNQAPNAFGKHANCHDSFGIFTAIEHNGDVRAALESSAHQLGLTYHRHDYSDHRERQGQDEVVLYHGDGDNEVIFLVDDHASGKRLSSQGCAALYIPSGMVDIGGWIKTVLEFPQRYGWFRSDQSSGIDLLMLSLDAKALQCPWSANELWDLRHGNQEVFVVDIAQKIQSAVTPSLRMSAKGR